MKNNIKAVLASALLVASTAGLLMNAIAPSRAAEPTTMGSVQAGNAAPDFKLSDSNGKPHELSQYKGKWVVLEWVNFGCPFVKKHYNSGNMQKLQETYTGKGVVWLSINSSAPGRQGSMSPADVNKALAEHHSHATAYLIDESGTVGRAYGAKATPTMFVINPKGEVVYAGAIDDKNTADEADIKTAKNYVSAALDEAMAGKPVAIASTKAYGCSVKYAQ